MPKYLLVVGAVVLSLASAALASPGGVVWAKTYNFGDFGPLDGGDTAYAAAASPDGTKVFVTGRSVGSNLGSTDYATIAYNQATGAALWTARYAGPGNDDDNARAIAVSPDSSQVFVTGESMGSSSGYDYATIAYDAATGGVAWVQRFNGSGNDDDLPHAMVLSPDGSKVFVTGASVGSHGRSDYLTRAYSSTTGAVLWTKRYNGPGDFIDDAYSVAVSPNGAKVFVTGRSAGAVGYFNYATIAYDATTGAERWVRRFDGSGRFDDIAVAVAVSPDSTRVFVTGSSNGSNVLAPDYTTISYRSSSGVTLWARRYNAPSDQDDIPSALAVSPNGKKIFVTGSSEAPDGNAHYATVSYDAANGALAWAKRYVGPFGGEDLAKTVAVSTDGTEVFVTGASTSSTSGYDWATLSYRAGSGNVVWTKRYKGTDHTTDIAYSLAPSPDGQKLFVAGGHGKSYATLAYSTV